MTRPVFSPGREYYDHVAKGYDRISMTYDQVEAANSVGRSLRRRMQSALSERFGPSDRILEIGCGTGIEAAFLASQGTRVHAIDVSEGMVHRTRERAETTGLTNLTVARLAAHEVGSLEEQFGRGGFDGAYSHGGALNMDPRLDEFATGLAKMVRSSGHFLSTAVNQTSLFEALFYPLVLNPRKGYRRLGNVIPIPITRLKAHRNYVIPTRFYSPNAFFRYFQRYFQLRDLSGLQILSPPWNLSEILDRFPPVATAMEAADEFFAKRRPFRSWGSLFLMDLIRTRE